MGKKVDNQEMDSKKVLKEIKGKLKPNKVALNTRIAPDLKQRLIDASKKEGITPNAMVEGILEAFLSDYFKKTK